MTRQEAAEKFFNLLHDERFSWTPNTVEALQMAIDALDEDNDVPDRNVGDKISRQAAIDAVFKLCDETDNPHVDAIVYELESLPSAQPKPLTDAEVVICKLYLDDLDKYKTCNEYKLLMGLLDGTASVQPEQKTGEWIYGEHDVAMCDGYRCNKCGFFVPWDYRHKSIDYIKDYHFCPNCGEKMENSGGETG